MAPETTRPLRPSQIKVQNPEEGRQAQIAPTAAPTSSRARPGSPRPLASRSASQLLTRHQKGKESDEHSHGATAAKAEMRYTKRDARTRESTAARPSDALPKVPIPKPLPPSCSKTRSRPIANYAAIRERRRLSDVTIGAGTNVMSGILCK